MYYSWLVNFLKLSDRSIRVDISSLLTTSITDIKSSSDIKRVHNIIEGESILIQYTLCKGILQSYDAIPMVPFNVLVGEIFAQQIYKGCYRVASISNPLEL